MSEAAQTTQPTSITQPTEPIVISGGDSPASWDELDALTAKPKAPKKESKPKEEKIQSVEKEAVEGKQKTDKKTQESKISEGIEKPASPAKLLKLKDGETDIELSADTKVPVKIDGKITEVSLQEAINRYSQQSHLDSLYKTYKTEKDGFEKQRTAMQDALNKSYSFLVEQKDLRGFLDYVGEAMGVDANALYQDTVGNLQQQLEEWQGLSPEERKLREVEAENAYYKKRMESQKQVKEQAKSQAALESQVQEMMQQNGMTNSDLVNAWDDLVNIGYNPNEIEPKFLADYHNNLKLVSLIQDEIRKYAPTKADNEDIVEEFATLYHKNQLKKEELIEAIKLSANSDDPVKDTNNKNRKNARATSQRSEKTPKNPASDPLTFDDLI